MNKITKILIFFLFLFIFDYLLTNLLPSNLNFYNYLNPKLDHRIPNINYHHGFKENVNTVDYWGPYKYNFITNSLGFKDSSNRKINKSNKKFRRIIFIGDSFTEGIGFEYKDTFVGLIDEEMKNKNIQILNAGVASQSPRIYFEKIRYFIKERELKFDELIVFLDISDIPDEFYYNINFKVNNNNKRDLRDNLQIFFIKNFSTYLFFDTLFSKINNFKENLIIKYRASIEFNTNFFKLSKTEQNLYKSITVERGNWIHDEKMWKTHGIEGRKLSRNNLNKLHDLLLKNNIKMTLVIYPWPNQIYFGYKNNIHRDYWRNWSKIKKVDFIDLFKYFETDKPKKIIDEYFIKGDIHWNKRGHKYIYNLIMNEYFKKDILINGEM